MAIPGRRFQVQNGLIVASKLDRGPIVLVRFGSTYNSKEWSSEDF